MRVAIPIGHGAALGTPGPVSQAPPASVTAAKTSADAARRRCYDEDCSEVDAKNISHPQGKKGIRVDVVSLGDVGFSGSFWQRMRREAAAAVENNFLRDVKRMIEGSGPRN